MPYEDLDLQPTPGPDNEPPRQSSAILWIVGIVVLLAVAAVLYWFLARGGPEPPAARTTAVREAPAAAPEREPLGRAGEPIALPPLDASDEIVRQLVSKLSSNPVVAAWLTTDGLIRHFTAGVQNVAAGRTPIEHARKVAPARPFQVTTMGGRTVIDPGSYARYDGIAEAVGSLDPDGTARLYSTLKPRIEEAYRELGTPDTPFDEALERAIVVLLRTPIVNEPPAVVPKGVGYAFADPRLEALAPAQKQLVRMGPENTKRVQASLRRIARALGIPEERLPPG